MSETVHRGRRHEALLAPTVFAARNLRWRERSTPKATIGPAEAQRKYAIAMSVIVPNRAVSQMASTVTRPPKPPLDLPPVVVRQLEDEELVKDWISHNSRAP